MATRKQRKRRAKEQRHEYGERRPQTRGENIRYPLVRRPARAEVGGGDLFQEDGELHGIRPVDAELAPDVLDLRRVGDLPGKEVRRIPPDPVEEEEHQQHHPAQGREELP